MAGRTPSASIPNALILEADILDNEDPASTQTLNYAYDPFNQLVRRTYDADGDGPAGASETFYSWDGGQITLEFDGPSALDLAHRYLWSPAAVDHLLADERIDDVLTPGDVLWPLADHLGTARDLVAYDPATDTAAVVNPSGARKKPFNRN